MTPLELLENKDGLKTSLGSSIAGRYEFDKLRERCENFSIPNVFLIVIGGDLNVPVKYVIYRNAFKLQAKAIYYGYKVNYMDYNKAKFTKTDIKAQKNNLYGFTFMGHGATTLPPDISPDDGDFLYNNFQTPRSEQISAIDMKSAYNYGLVIAKFCSSSLGDWKSLVSDYGRIHDTNGRVTLPFIFIINQKLIYFTLKNMEKLYEEKCKKNTLDYTGIPFHMLCTFLYFAFG